MRIQLAMEELLWKWQKKKEYDLILMDVKLPTMNGVEATKAIRAHEGELKRKSAVIFGLTGSTDEEDLKAYELAGMDGCIEKGCVLTQAIGYALSKTPSTSPTCLSRPTSFLFIGAATLLPTGSSMGKNAQNSKMGSSRKI